MPHAPDGRCPPPRPLNPLNPWQVFERLPEPPAPDDLSVWADFEQASERLYMIGLNGRGQAGVSGEEECMHYWGLRAL